MAKITDFFYLMKKLFVIEDTVPVSLRLEETLNKKLDQTAKKLRMNKTDIIKMGIIFVTFLFAEGYFAKLIKLATAQNKDIGQMLYEIINAGFKAFKKGG
jgi:hypothetical protein